MISPLTTSGTAQPPRSIWPRCCGCWRRFGDYAVLLVHVVGSDGCFCFFNPTRPTIESDRQKQKAAMVNLWVPRSQQRSTWKVDGTRFEESLWSAEESSSTLLSWSYGPVAPLKLRNDVPDVPVTSRIILPHAIAMPCRVPYHRCRFRFVASRAWSAEKESNVRRCRSSRSRSRRFVSRIKRCLRTPNVWGG